jgi:hypothetical protein
MPSGGAVLYIRFTIEVTCGEEEPSRFVPRVEGEVFDFVGDEADEREVLVGRIGSYLVQRSRSFDEGESLFDAMDSIDQSVHDCYCALFDPKNDEWSASVLATYGDSIMSMDVLYIESIDLEAQFKSMDITPIVHETIATFGRHCGLVAHEELAENAKVWTDIGFRKLTDSDFYTYAPELLHQESDEPVPSSSVSWANRVRRGRRRLG